MKRENNLELENTFIVNSIYGKHAKTYLIQKEKSKYLELLFDGILEDFIIEVAKIASDNHSQLIVLNNTGNAEKNETMNLMSRDVVFKEMEDLIDNKIRQIH